MGGSAWFSINSKYFNIYIQGLWGWSQPHSFYIMNCK